MHHDVTWKVLILNLNIRHRMSFLSFIALVLTGVACLLQVESASAQKHVQVTGSAALTDSDLGGTWTKSTFGEGWGWFDIAISSNGKNQTAIAQVGTVTSLYQSSDYGETWFLSKAPQFDSKTTPNQAYYAVATSSDGRYIAAAVAAAGAIYLSSDYGATWAIPAGPPAEAFWWDIAMSADGSSIGAVISGSYMWYSRDHGVTWDRTLSYDTANIHSQIEENYFSIDISADGVYWVLACGPGGYTQGNVYYGTMSTNGLDDLVFERATMNGVPAGATLQWVGVAMSADGSKVTALNSLVEGGVFQSTDQGATFYLTLTAPPVMSLHEAAMSDDGSVQVVTTLGANGRIYLTKDGGTSWNASSPVSTSWEGVAVDDGGDFMAAADSGVGVYSYLPNCPYGEVHTGFSADGVNGCVPCGAGSYEEYFGAATCTDCAEGSYSTTDANYLESTCKDCVYPWTTLGEGGTSCFVFWLEASLGFYLPLCGLLLAVLAVIFIFGNDSQLVALIIMGFPALDVLTDLVYLLISRFYSLAIFILCLMFFLHPAPMFVYKLYKYRAWPYSIRYIWWLGSSSTHHASSSLHGAGTPEHEANQGDHIPFPTILGRRFTLLISFHHHDNLYVMILELFTWIVAIALQGLTLILLPAFLVFWLCAGVFLQMTKTIAMGSVWNFWFHVWTGYTHWSDVPGSIDTEDLNYGLLTQFCLETIPHIILQSVNNTLLGTWVSDPIAIFSLVMSIFMAVATIYKYVYHVGIRADRQEMRNVPLDKSVTIKMMCSDFEYTILNAKLAPHSRNIMVPTAEQLKFQDHKYAVAGTDAESDVVSPLNSAVPPVVDGSTNSTQSSSANSPLSRSVHAGDQEHQAQPQMAYAEAVYSDRDYSAKSTPTAPPALSPQPQAQSAFRPVISVPYIPPPTQVHGSSSSGALMTMTLPSPSTRDGASPATAPAVLGGSPVPSDYPPELICPLTRHVMTDPVICADGYTYERAAIEQHIRSQKDLLEQMGHPGSATSPITKEKLDTEQLFPNRALAALLAKYQGV